MREVFEPSRGSIRMSKSMIYGLVDPRDNFVHYVGKSTKGLNRPKEHRRSSVLKVESDKNTWLRELFSSGYDYEIAVLEYIDEPKAPGTTCWWWAGLNATALNDAERWWIAYGRASGWPLTNMTDGGDGVSGEYSSMKNPTTVAKALATKVANGTNRHSGETRRKMSVAGVGRVCSEETRKKLRLANKDKTRGRAQSPEHVAKRQAAKIVNGTNRMSSEQRSKMCGRTLSEETRQKISIALQGKGKGVPLSLEHRANIGLANKGKNLGKRDTPETRLKKSLNNAMKRPEVRAKHRAAMLSATARTFDDLQRSTIASALKLRWRAVAFVNQLAGLNLTSLAGI